MEVEMNQDEPGPGSAIKKMNNKEDRLLINTPTFSYCHFILNPRGRVIMIMSTIVERRNFRPAFLSEGDYDTLPLESLYYYSYDVGED